MTHTPGPPDPADPYVSALLERCRFPEVGPGDVGHEVAVSGGADSTALLALALATRAPVTAHHIDHGLRGDGAAEAEFVAGLCESWGAAFRSYAVDVADGPDLEARCRAARLEVLPPGALTGHTADDQAETVLLRLLRGSGPAGLSGMEPARHPLLGLRRRDTEALCDHLGVTPLVDPTNESPRFTRNRVRHEVLPLLADVAGHDVVPLLNRTAELVSAQNEAIATWAATLDPRDAAGLREVPVAVAAESLRQWWESTTGGLPPPDRAAMQRIMEVVRRRHRGTEVGAGWRLDRSAGRLRLSRTAGTPGVGPEGSGETAN